jgi:anti-anti-sigma factor
MFEMRERPDVDGSLRLTLLGELDLPVAETLSARLEELKVAGRPVRLDLSEVTFIDSSGLQALIVALTGARWTGWQLEVAPEVSPIVARAAEIVGIAQVLWPQERSASPSSAPPAVTPPHELA